MSDTRKKLAESIENAKKLYEGDVSDFSEAEYIAECLLSEGLMFPPCKVGDTVYWLDAIKNIVPIEVGGFEAEIVDKNGNTYCGGIYLTEDKAKARREELRVKECKQCLTQGINGNYLVGCEKGFECSKKPIVERNGGHWLSQTESKVSCKYEINHSYEYNRCKRCYMNMKRKGEYCLLDETNCPYAIEKTLHSEKWDEEFNNSKECEE